MSKKQLHKNQLYAAGGLPQTMSITKSPALPTTALLSTTPTFVSLTYKAMAIASFIASLLQAYYMQTNTRTTVITTTSHMVEML